MVCLHSERSNVECSNCDSGDPASNRCAMCCQFLCEFCTAAHKRGRSTKTHRLMSLEEVKEEGPLAVTLPSLCKEHERKVLKLFCETCDEAICRDCTIVKHRDHKYTFVKDTFVKEKDTVMKILSETKTKASTIQNSLDGISEMKRNIHSQVEKTVKDITNCFNDLRISLNTRQNHLINEVEEIGKTKLKFLEIQQEKLEAALGIVQSSVEFTEKAFKNGSEVHILNMRKQMSTRLQELNSTKWQLEPCADDSVKFKADNQLKQDVATFGVVTEVETHAGASTVTMGHGSEGVIYNTLCDQPIEFTITAKERNGQKRTEGGDQFTATCIEGQNIEILDVNDLGDGTYTFSYTPLCQEGQCGLFVEMGGHDVQGSPFTWFIEKWHLLKNCSENIEGQIQLSKEKRVAQYTKIPIKMPHEDEMMCLELQDPFPRPAARKSTPDLSALNSVPGVPLPCKLASKTLQPPLPSQLNRYDKRLLFAPESGRKASSLRLGQPQVFGQPAARSKCSQPQGFKSRQKCSGPQPRHEPKVYRQEPSSFGEDFTPYANFPQGFTSQQQLFGPQPLPLREGFTPQQFVFGQSASSSHFQPAPFGKGVTPQQNLFGSSTSSSADLPLQQKFLGEPFTPQQTLFGQTSFVDQSASTSSVAVLHPSQLDNVERRLYVVGSASLSAGKHSWKAKLLGNVSDGFSFGIINAGAPAKAYRWVWNSKANQVLSPSMYCEHASNMTDCASSDIIEMYLDCDAGNLMMYNQRTKQSDIWYGVEAGAIIRDGDRKSILQVVPM